MKKIFVILFALVLAVGVNAQTPTVKQFQESAMALMQQGDFTNAMVALEKAKAIEPKNLETIKNISFCFYLQREFAQALMLVKLPLNYPMQTNKVFKF
jgi:Tfp pilus assembly protein PilF